ncbi:MAG: hypothetical protein J6Y17_02500 [Elusimicrobiaceae bacterium]|nr:hypothetical protein [Elusimicrobiaceae bacterium]
MKKLLLAGLAGMLCLSATSSIAQVPQGTLQDKVVSLEVQNRVLSEKISSLEKEIRSLRSQAASSVKPYYVSASVQNKCEKFVRLSTWAALHYEDDQYFKVEGVCETSGFFQNTNTLRHQLWLQTSRGIYVYTREGKGRNPSSWNEHIFTGHHMPPCSWNH